MSDSTSALQAQLNLIQKQLELVTSRLSKGKGRGKKSQPSEGRPQGGLLNRLRTSFSSQGLAGDLATQGTSQASQRDSNSDAASIRSDNSEAPPPPYSDVILGQQRLQAGKKTVHIQNVQLLLNGVPLDQIDTTETEDECIRSYFKFNQNCGYGHGLFTSGISYEDYR